MTLVDPIKVDTPTPLAPTARSARRQRLVAHLHAAGPRPCLEALIEVANGRDLDDVLERFASVPINTYRALGADILPIHRLTLVDGDAA